MLGAVTENLRKIFLKRSRPLLDTRDIWSLVGNAILTNHEKSSFDKTYARDKTAETIWPQAVAKLVKLHCRSNT
jgi:hypothetical protein